MHESNQTNIGGVNVSYPLIFTGNQCKREFSVANALLEHINIYDRQLPEIDYLFFSELRDSIKKITDNIQRKDFTVTSGGDSSTKKEYYFSNSKELLSIVESQGTLTDEIMILDSLKKRHMVIKTRKDKTQISTINKAFFTKTMDYDRFEENLVYKGETTDISNKHPRREKFVFNNGKARKKTQFINNSREQSKVEYFYYPDSNIERVVARSQKNKAQILYQSLYTYNESRNIDSISFEFFNDESNTFRKEYKFNYDSNENLMGTDKELIFYDKIGNIIQIIDKPSAALVFERTNSYQYDNRGNWIRKKSELIRHVNGCRELIETIDYKRTIEYIK
jgi:hypothetical protein